MSAKALPPFNFRIHQMADESDQSEGCLNCADGTLFSVEFADHDADETRAVVAELTRRLNAFDDLLHACKWVIEDAIYKAPEQYQDVRERGRILNRWMQCLQGAVKKAEVQG